MNTRSYEEVRDERKQKRKEDKAARKAAKPQGIDLPLWKMMPAPLLAIFVAATIVAIGTVIVLLIKPPQPSISVAERRSPPVPGFSHNVGAIVLAPLPAPLPKTAPPCSALKGVIIEGGVPAQGRIGGVLQRMCPFLSDDPDFARSLQSLTHARIRFARFARTGDPSTLSLGPPATVLLNIRFARHDQSALYIAPLLAHEGYHLWHSNERFNAEQEFGAREVELHACRLMIPVDAWPRECTDAQQLVNFGHDRAVRSLKDAGFA